MTISQKFVSDVLLLVHTAGHQVMSHYSGDIISIEKSDSSPVTMADLTSHTCIQEGLLQYDIPVLSEESKNPQALHNSEKKWILDPLDGTKDFIQKTDDFSIMLGLVEDGQPIFGVVYCPAKNKTYYAVKGEGAYVIEKTKSPLPIQVSSVNDLLYARLVVSRNHLGTKEIAIAKEAGVREMRKVGSNGVKLGLIAENNADFFLNLSDKMGLWDSCAPHIIIEEAGGRITDAFGKEIRYDTKETKNKYGIVASNGVIHDDLIERINV
ncbi:3'(2'),5'-bisphosphate nucleotidase CysQ [Patescibacteria group bacterium]|nr:3'(2'),5'-bisphosphate nucleotidase CysQ [Patescibacteria group bacterium]